MPPVKITGVMASEISPISTASRTHSKKLAAEKKFFPMMLNSAISTAISRARISSCLFVERFIAAGGSCEGGAPLGA